MQIVSECQTAKTGLEQEHGQKRLEYFALGEKADDVGQRTCHVIGVDAHELAAKRAGEGVEHRAALHDLVSQSLKEIYVLTVQVKHQNRAVSEGVYLH